MAAALLVCAIAGAQEPGQQVQALMPGEKPKPTKYVAVETQKEHLVFFQGFSLSVDVYGPVAYAVSDYGTAEGALRVNLKNTFFPIVEMGLGRCEKEDFNTKIAYKANAPYARIGVDINMLSDKFQSNRLYLGARYGISKFSYDMIAPDMTDPIWGGSASAAMKDIDCTSHWAELVMGVDVKIFRNLHMGWAVRYKRELASTKSDFAKPNCIPGYGYTTNSTCWGATYNLIFDLNWGLKKSHKQGVSVELRDIPNGNTPDGNDKEAQEERKENNKQHDNEEGTDEEHDTEEGTEAV